MKKSLKQQLGHVEKSIVACRKCPRLIAWCEQVAKEKRAAYADDTYWGKPVPGFGDPNARLMVVGLAPGAHGANRTGRVFTGDRSGDWLYRALHKAGFANQPTSASRDDGLKLIDAYVTAIVRCAPPGNKPTPDEKETCIPYFRSELTIMTQTRVLLALGSFAWDGILRVLAEMGYTQRPKPKFVHAAQLAIGPYTLIGSYHPSQQNTFTGKLTEPMFDRIFRQAANSLKS